MQKLLARLLFPLIALSAACVGDIGPTSLDLTDGASDAGKKRGGKDAGAEQRRSSDVDRKCPSGRAKPLASQVRITEIALYQSVKISLYKDGSWITEREAPVIQGKRAMVRVFVEPLVGYEPHSVQGVLTLQNGDRLLDLVDERVIESTSSDEDEESTFMFDIPADRLGPDVRFSVVLEELDCLATAGTADDARFPSLGGRQPLVPETVGPLHVVVVPMLVDGRLPSLGEDERQKIRDALLAYYPVSTVEVTQHTPLSAGEALSAEGDRGALAEELLHRLKEARFRDQPATNVYYLGLYQPAATFRAFCADVCVLGLAPQTIRIQPNEQYAVAAFFATAQSYDTIVHELGHAHGRGHSPCNTGIVPKGIDENYPMRNGAIGDWGWDVRENKLVPPSVKDVMGYCEPRWISAYTYRELAQRSVDVNNNVQALVSGSVSALRWRYVMLHADGRARWGGSIITEVPAGKSEQARVLDASGREIAKVEIARVALSHSDGEFVYFPEPGAQWDAIEWSGHRLSLATVLPPPGF